jgi:hypothetical protein
MINPELVALISQQHEAWLNELEGLAIEAIATNDWTAFYTHVVDFQNEHELHGEALIAIGEDEPSDSPSEASTKSLTGSGADLFSQTN